jgi:DNA N-6-adenine-methyltransferase (Dam)
VSERSLGTTLAYESPVNRWDEWLTPPHVIRALGTFDLDPCAAANQPWRTAAWQIALPVDGLSAQWTGRVWCNPPYGNKTARWVRRMAAHGHGTLLVFARPDVGWFHEAADLAHNFLFLRGRLKFHDSAGVQRDAAPCGSVLFAFGAGDALHLSSCNLDGLLCTGRRKLSEPLLQTVGAP